MESQLCDLTLNLVGFTPILFQSACDARLIYMGEGWFYRFLFIWEGVGFTGFYLYGRGSVLRVFIYMGEGRF